MIEPIEIPQKFKYLNLQELLPKIMYGDTRSVDLQNTLINEYSAPYYYGVEEHSYGKRILSLHLLANGNIVCAYYQGEIQIWDPNNRKCIKSSQAHKCDIYTLGESSNQIIVSSDHFGTIAFWDLRDDSQKSIKLQDNHSPFVILSDDTLISAGNSKLYFWPTLQKGIPNDNTCNEVLNNPNNYFAIGYPIDNMVLLNDKKTLVLGVRNGTQGDIVLFDTVTKEIIRTIQNAHSCSSGYPAIAVLPNNYFVTCLLDKDVKMWDAAGNLMSTLKTPHIAYSLFVMPDGSLLRSIVSDDNNNGKFDILNWQNGALTYSGNSLTGHTSACYLNAIVALPGGQMFTTSYWDKSTRLWSFQKRNIKLSDIQLILDALKTNKSVISLNLNGVLLGDEGAQKIVDLIKINKSLIALDVRNTGISRKGKLQIVEAIKEHKSSICFIDLSHDPLEPHLTPEAQEQFQLLLAVRQNGIKQKANLNFFALSDMTVPTLGLAEQQKAEAKWIKPFSHNPTLSKKIKETSQQITSELLQSVGTCNAWQFDLKFIQVLPKKLSLSPEEKMVFNTQAQQTLQNYSVQMQEAHKIIGNTFTFPFSSVANKLTGAIQEIGLGKEVGGIISEVLESTSNFDPKKIEPESIIKVTENLFGKVNGMVAQLSTINQLKDELYHLENSPIVNKLEAFNIKLKLQNAQKALESFAHEGITFQTLNQGFEAVGSILSIVGVSSTLVNQVVTVGKAAVTIADGIGKIAAGISAGAALGVIGAIGGAIAGIFSLFGSSGPSKEEKMLSQISEQINKVAEHMDNRFNRLEQIICAGITQLAKHVDQRFDRVEKILWTMQTYQDRRFDALEGMLGQFYTTSMRQFAELGNQLAKIQLTVDQAADTIHKSITGVGDLIVLYAQDNKKQQYIRLKQQAFDNFRQNPSLGGAVSYASEFMLWSTSESTAPELTGVTHHINQIDICKEIEKKGIAFSIQPISVLLKGLNDQLDHSARIAISQNIANPQIWIDAARNYMRFIWQVLVLNNSKKKQPFLSEDFLSGQADSIQKIIRTGKDLEQFFLGIRKNPALFHLLCENYRKQVQAIIDLCQKAKTWDQPLKDSLAPCLDALAITYKLLHMCTALSFYSEYKQESTLRTYLQVQLWSEKELLHYLANLVTENSFAVNTIDKSLLKSIDGFEDVILEKIAQADCEFCTGYPLLDETLQELEIFEGMLTKFQFIPQVVQHHPVQIQQPMAQPSMCDEFNNTLASLIKMDDFSFNIERMSEKKLKITFTGDALNEAQIGLKSLYECFKNAIKSLDLIKDMESSKVDYPTGTLVITCKTVEALNQIGKLFETSAEEFLTSNPKPVLSRVLFFKEIEKVSENMVSEKSGVTCTIQ